ncbi:caveolin-2 [Austrofundulus limnaeus]|uniref:Caveolin n=1 Tax=Austrofundulus limnaeus TaxID=52670 RepID=A0A2I4BDA9_AUSLI|nr:PREDICTED: caveolin-2 [Austrofundulus limnaeus]
MGVEKERSDTSIIMDEFNRSKEPILSKNKKGFAAVPDRDPSGINAHLKVGFEDLIAEPVSAHSFDRVWVGSHATFELVKFFFYRLLSALLAVPAAFLLGLLFGGLSCVRVWLVMPTVQSFMMLLPSLQIVWRSLMDTFTTPLFHSVGKSLSSVRVQTAED